MSNDTAPGESLLGILVDSGLSDELIDAVDAGIDAVVDNEIVERLPIVGLLVKLTKVGLGFREYLFLKKLARFLFHLRDVNQEEREQYVARIQASPDERKRLGEHLILLLDRFEDVTKPEYLARGFEAYLQGTITLDEFMRLSLVVDRCYLEDLEAIRGMKGEVEIPPHVATPLASCGVLEPTGFPSLRGPRHEENLYTEAIAESRSGARYQLTALGAVAKRILLRPADE